MNILGFGDINKASLIRNEIPSSAAQDYEDMAASTEMAGNIKNYTAYACYGISAILLICG